VTIHNVVLPSDLALGFTGGPEFATEVEVLEGGHEFRNSTRDDARVLMQAGYTGKDLERTKRLLAFFRARRGMRYGFLVQDPLDGEASITEGVFDTADGSPSGYQFVKRYADDDAYTQDRIIYKPMQGTISVKSGAFAMVEGAHYIIEYSTGALYTVGSPIVVPTAWSGDFYTPVRFDRDRPDFIVIEPDVINWNNLGLVELLEP
jgi:uncharacterized protein (TIGR02217 family)